jgi:hypothetical protein
MKVCMDGGWRKRTKTAGSTTIGMARMPTANGA